MNRKRAYFFLTVINFVMYGLNGIYFSYISEYLSNYQSPVQVGYLVALGQLVMIFAPMFWGVRADKAKYKNSPLLICIIGGMVSISLIGVNPQSFVYLLVVIFTLLCFQSAFSGLSDAVSIGYASENGMKFGFMRCMGTIAYGVATLAVSALYEIAIEWFIYTYLILASLGIVAVIFAPKVKGYHTQKGKMDFAPIFLDKKLMGYVMLCTMSQFLWQFYLSLYPGYVTETLGMSQTAWGTNILITVSSEIPFFLLIDVIFRKFKTEKIMLVGLILTALRYLALGLLTDLLAIQICSFVTGVSASIIQYCCIKYISENLPLELQATAINLPTVLPFGVGRMIASVMSGYCYDYFGTPNTMLGCAVFAVVCSAYYYIAKAAKDKKAIT